MHGLSGQNDGGCRLRGQFGLARLDSSQSGGNRVYAIRALLLQLLAAGLTGLLVASLSTDAIGFQPLFLGFETLLGSLGLLGLVQASSW